MKKIILTIVIIIGISTFSFGQDEILAKSYFLKAQEAYGNGENAKAIRKLDKTVEFLGATNAKIEALYVRIASANKKYSLANTHIKKYFEKATEKHSSYNDMLALYADIKSKHEREERYIKRIITKQDFSKGPARYYKDGKYGFMDKTGTIVIPVKYDEASEFDEDGHSFVKLNKKWGSIDKTGAMVIPIKYHNLNNEGAFDFDENGISLARIKRKKGYIDKKGIVVIPFIYDKAFKFSEGLAKVGLKRELYTEYGFIDRTGKVIIPIKHQFALSFSEGLAAVSPKTYGSCSKKIYCYVRYIDKTGKIIIPPRSYGESMNEVGSFKNGYAIVKYYNRWTYIDKNGGYIPNSGIGYDRVYGFKNDLSAVKLFGKFGFIDKKGNKIIPIKYDGVWSFGKNGLAAVKLNDKWGFVDNTGKIIAPCKYDKVKEYTKNGLVVVELNGKLGKVDKQGNFTLDK